MRTWLARAVAIALLATPVSALAAPLTAHFDLTSNSISSSNESDFGAAAGIGLPLFGPVSIGVEASRTTATRTAGASIPELSFISGGENTLHTAFLAARVYLPTGGPQLMLEAGTGRAWMSHADETWYDMNLGHAITESGGTTTAMATMFGIGLRTPAILGPLHAELGARRVSIRQADRPLEQNSLRVGVAL